MSDLKTELASLRIDRDRPAAASRRWPLLLLLPGVRPPRRPLRDAGRRVAGRGRGRDRAGRARARRDERRRSRHPHRVRLRRRAAQGRGVREDPGPAGRPPGRGGRSRPRRRADRPPREQRLPGPGAARAGAAAARRGRPGRERAPAAAGQRPRRASRSSPATRSTSRRAACASRRPPSPRPGPRSAYAQAQMQNTRILAPFTGTVVKKMAEVGESVAPIPPGREPLDVVGRDRGPRRPRHARGGGRRQRIQRGEARARAAGRGHRRGLPRSPLPRGAAADHPHRRPHQGDGAGEGDDPRQGPAAAAGDEREGPVRGAEGRGERALGRRWSRCRRTRWRAATASRWCSRSSTAARGCAASSPAASARDAWWCKEGLLGTETLVVRPPETLKDGDAVRIEAKRS